MKFTNLHPTTRRLILARSFRSIGQGALVVDMALYLHALGWNGFRIGLVLSAAGLFGAFMSLGVGIASDRMRRRPFLLVYEGIVFVCSMAALFTAGSALLAAVIVIAGFGRGANGAAGPFSPAEQAWLAEEVPAERRGKVYSLNTAFGFFGMGLGALLAVTPAFLGARLAGGRAALSAQAAGYRPLFAVVAAATLVNLFLLYGAKEKHGSPGRRGVSKGAPEEAKVRKEENRMLTGLSILNSVNGLAVGFTGPLISYWFALRFGVGPAAIAPVMALTFFITGGAALLTGKLSERIGIVSSVVWARSFGLLLLILLPLAPVFWLASLVFILRSAMNRGSVGARQALTVGLVRDERRGLATSLNAVSMQVPQSVGPSVAGFLFSSGQLEAPFYAGALFQGIYLAAYAWFFRKHNRPGVTVPEDED
jgi:predicted MFS family arabinose efflux permease